MRKYFHLTESEVAFSVAERIILSGRFLASLPWRAPRVSGGSLFVPRPLVRSFCMGLASPRGVPLLRSCRSCPGFGGPAGCVWGAVRLLLSRLAARGRRVLPVWSPRSPRRVSWLVGWRVV